jgi:phosphate-selective porin OprO and OprP
LRRPRQFDNSSITDSTTSYEGHAMRGIQSLASAILCAGVCGVAVGQAQSAPPDSATLLRRLEEAEQRIRALEQKLEEQEKASKTAAASAPQVRATPTRFSIGTADGQSFVRFRGLVHVDGRHFEGDGTPGTSNQWLLRRVRPSIEGTFGGLFDFRIVPDFGGGRTVIQDAYVTARFRPYAAITVGKFKVPLGLERLQSANDTRFIERAFVTSLVPNRDLGVQLGGEISDGLFSYNVSYTNGTFDGVGTDANATPDQENDAKGDISGRVFFQPFLKSDMAALRGAGFGIASTYVDSTGSTTNPLLPSYRTPGQAVFFSYANGTFASGERFRLTPQAYYYFKNLGLMAEYAVVSQDVSRVVGTEARPDSLDHKAWHLQFSWLLTGEDETFRAPTVNTPFQIGKPGWGAWEVVARVHELSLDEDAFSGGAASFANPATAASRARAAGLGLNWYLNSNVKWQLAYDYTQFDGGAPVGDRPDERAYFTRVGLSF